MRNTIGSVIMLALVGLILFYAFVIGPSQDCQRKGVMFNRPYIFHPLDGCWIQTAQGNWQRVDQPVNPSQYQP
jgi:hypothetical protein